MVDTHETNAVLSDPWRFPGLNRGHTFPWILDRLADGRVTAPELDRLIVSFIPFKTLLLLRASSSELRAWVENRLGNFVARAICTTYGCSLGPAPFGTLENLKSRLDSWYRVLVNPHIQYTRIPVFQSARTFHIAHNMGMLLHMNMIGEVSVFLAPANERGRDSLSRWNWVAPPTIPRGIKGQRYVDRILLSGEGQAVFVILEQTHRRHDGLHPHRIEFQVVDVKTGHPCNGFEREPWSPSGVQVNPASALFKQRSSIAFCGVYVMFPAFESSCGNYNVDFSADSLVVCIVRLDISDVVMTVPFPFAFITFLDKTTVIVLNISTGTPNILSHEREYMDKLQSRESVCSDDEEPSFYDEPPPSDTLFSIYYLNRGGELALQLRSPMTVYFGPGFSGNLPAIGADVGLPYPRGSFIDQDTVFRPDENQIIRYLLPDQYERELQLPGPPLYPGLLGFTLKVSEMQFCLDTGNRPTHTEPRLYEVDEWAHGCLNVSHFPLNHLTWPRTTVGTMSDRLDYHPARLPKDRGSPLVGKDIERMNSSSKIELRQVEWEALWWRDQFMIHNRGKGDLPSLRIAEPPTYFVLPWDVDQEGRQAIAGTVTRLSRPGLNNRFPGSGREATLDTIFEVQQVFLENEPGFMRFDRSYTGASFLVPKL